MKQRTSGSAHFDRWPRNYGTAWEQRDSAAAARLFSAAASYYRTPFDPPSVGHAAIAAALRGATDSQRDVRFEYEILSAGQERGIAAWSACFNRVGTRVAVRVEGVLSAEWDGDGKCCCFREWWHLLENVPSA
jgi:hypothetical protein